ncbi:MAG: aminopeptidase P family protein [Clostridia bacterium]|nr:aminopeptidase P family protein [Clostridia bacterium]
MSKNNDLRALFFDAARTEDGILIASEENRRYLTDFPSSDGFVLLTTDDAVFLTDSRYIEAAQAAVTTMRTEEQKETFAQLSAFFAGHGVKNIHIEAERMTVAQMNRLRAALSDFSIVADGRLDDCIGALRCIKYDDEVARIVKAQRIAEAALTHIYGFIAPGKTEKEIALELDHYMLSHGAEALSFETIAVSGANSSMPHGVPSDKKIEVGDFITMDFGAVWQGLHSDMTRTVAVGRVSEKQKLVYNTVLEAQQTAEAAVRAGVPAAQIDKIARDIIENAGFGAYFRHGTGHGVGYEIHELPNVSPRSNYTLQSGNIITVEPGIYIPGEFGVRIEDMMLVNETDGTVLTDADHQLIIL